MYERFTDRARKVLELAQQEAQRFNHEYIGTEHILLGLIKEGSGVAANVLKNLDVDYLKIDGSFVRNLSHDPVDEHLVLAMVHLASGLGKRTIAEFVEDGETLEILRKIGVDCAQGFYIGRPRPLEEILAG